MVGFEISHPAQPCEKGDLSLIPPSFVKSKNPKVYSKQYCSVKTDMFQSVRQRAPFNMAGVKERN